MRKGGGGGGGFRVGSIGVGRDKACMNSSSSEEVGDEDSGESEVSNGFFFFLSSERALNSGKGNTPLGYS